MLLLYANRTTVGITSQIPSTLYVQSCGATINNIKTCLASQVPQELLHLPYYHLYPSLLIPHENEKMSVHGKADLQIPQTMKAWTQNEVSQIIQ